MPPSRPFSATSWAKRASRTRMALPEARMTYLRAFFHLVAYSLRRQLRSRKVLLGIVLLGMLSAVVVLIGIRTTWSARMFGEVVVLHMMALFFVPVITLMFGTAAIGDERDEKSLVYVLTRPLPRWAVYV